MSANVKKVYKGKYPMPHSIELAIHSFCSALKEHGYFGGNLNIYVTNECDSVHLFTEDEDGNINGHLVELVHGEWLEFNWSVDDEQSV